jgi:RNA polymerase sigma-70 factor (ECF subfamily)
VGTFSIPETSIPETNPGRSDADLLAAHVAGDRYAFEELFRRYQAPLLRLALGRSRSVEDAADALQEAMLSAHRSAPEFRQHCTVSTWLHRIVLNKCVDQLRAHRRRHLLANQCGVFPTGFGPSTDATVRVDTAIVVRRALAALSDDQRAAVVTIDMQGYSIADAAELLGVAEGTVKSRCSRGRARLAALLAGGQSRAAA